MKRNQSRLTGQGQISVPAEIRKRLSLAPGAVLEWNLDGDEIIIRRAGLYSLEDVQKTLFSEPPKAKTLDELKQGIRKNIQRRHARR